MTIDDGFRWTLGAMFAGIVAWLAILVLFALSALYCWLRERSRDKRWLKEARANARNNVITKDGVMR